MTFVWTPRFEKAYQALSPEMQEAVDSHLQRLEQNWRHPSLKTKKLGGKKSIWYLRISQDLRLTFEPRRQEVFLRNVGPHDATLRSP